MDSASSEYRANVPLGLALLVGQAVLLFMLPWKPSLLRGPAAQGDPDTVIGAVFFAYWSAILGAAYRFPKKCFLFAFLAKLRPGPAVFAVVLALVAAYLFAKWQGWLW